MRRSSCSFRAPEGLWSLSPWIPDVFDIARNDLGLLADIVDFTARFYPRSWAHFELCKPGTMLLQPSDHALPGMKADYAAMRTMIYGDYPSFDEILLNLTLRLGFT